MNKNYFHKVAHGKRSRKVIGEIRTQEGTIIISEENIHRKIKANFENRFKKGSIYDNTLQKYPEIIDKEVIDIDNEKLTCTITNDEIKKQFLALVVSNPHDQME